MRRRTRIALPLGGTTVLGWLLFALMLVSPRLLTGGAEHAGEGTVVVAYVTPRVFDVTVDDGTYPVLVDANSTLYGFRFDPADPRLILNLSGDAGTVGFCNVTFPSALLGGPYLCNLDDVPVTTVETGNATHAALYVTYTHSVHTLEIVGTTVIPEFILGLAAMLMLLVGGVLLLLRVRLAHDGKTSGPSDRGGNVDRRKR